MKSKDIFKAEDYRLLLELIDEHKTLAPLTLFPPSVSKKEIWKEITKEFNAKRPTEPELLFGTVRHKWYSLKAQAIKHAHSSGIRNNETLLKVIQLLGIELGENGKVKNTENDQGNELSNTQNLFLAECSKPEYDSTLGRKKRKRKKPAKYTTDLGTFPPRKPSSILLSILQKEAGSNPGTKDKKKKSNSPKNLLKENNPKGYVRNKKNNRSESSKCFRKFGAKPAIKNASAKTFLFYHNLTSSKNPAMIPNARRDFGLGDKQMGVIYEFTGFADCNRVDVFLVLRKIRRNEPLDVLGFYFNRSKGQVLYSLNKTTPLLSLFLFGLIFSPPQDLIAKNLPTPYYPSLEAIVTYLNIPISRPKENSAKLENVKGYRMRFLVAITPDGFIRFVSKSFAGSDSDDKIFKESGFIDQLQSGAMITAKSAPHSLLAEKGCVCINIPGLFDVSAQQPNIGQGYRAVLHAVVKRIFGYSLLLSLDSSLLKHIDDIIVIVCALANAQGPVIQSVMLPVGSQIDK